MGALCSLQVVATSKCFLPEQVNGSHGGNLSARVKPVPPVVLHAEEAHHRASAGSAGGLGQLPNTPSQDRADSSHDPKNIAKKRGRNDAEIFFLGSYGGTLGALSSHSTRTQLLLHAQDVHDNASAGNRAQVTSMATTYSTTRPLMPC